MAVCPSAIPRRRGRSSPCSSSSTEGPATDGPVRGTSASAERRGCPSGTGSRGTRLRLGVTERGLVHRDRRRSARAAAVVRRRRRAALAGPGACLVIPRPHAADALRVPLLHAGGDRAPASAFALVDSTAEGARLLGLVPDGTSSTMRADRGLRDRCACPVRRERASSDPLARPACLVRGSSCGRSRARRPSSSRISRGRVATGRAARGSGCGPGWTRSAVRRSDARLGRRPAGVVVQAPPPPTLCR